MGRTPHPELCRYTQDPIFPATQGPQTGRVAMHGSNALIALGAAFLISGLLARAGVRIGLPTIPLFVVAGIMLGPNTPGVELFSDPGELRLLAELGLIFLLFYLGLEFSFDELVDGGRKLALAGCAYLALNVGGGFLFGLSLGWGLPEALVLAGVLGISSSAIASKLLIELGRLGSREAPLIFGIILVEDLFLAFYLALLAPVIGGAESAQETLVTMATAFAFLIALAAVARWGADRVAKLVDDRDDELLIIGFTGLAVLGAGVAEHLGVSDAIGALMMGLIIGSGGLAERVKVFVRPLRDAFGAIFFFAFGLAISPAALVSVAGPIAAAVALTVVLNIVAGVVAARIHGLGREAAASIGLTVLARGEFALVLAAMAAAAGLDPRLPAFVAGYVLVLAILGPLAANHSDRLAGLRSQPAAAPEGTARRPVTPGRLPSGQARSRG